MEDQCEEPLGKALGGFPVRAPACGNTKSVNYHMGLCFLKTYGDRRIMWRETLKRLKLSFREEWL